LPGFKAGLINFKTTLELPKSQSREEKVFSGQLSVKAIQPVSISARTKAQGKGCNAERQRKAKNDEM
jgi:hypothetical protein